jgi:hypothetical protein
MLQHAKLNTTAAMFYAYPIGHRMVSDDYCLIDHPSILLDFCDWASEDQPPPSLMLYNPVQQQLTSSCLTPAQFCMSTRHALRYIARILCLNVRGCG